jgi:predicted extracellular nuclease
MNHCFSVASFNVQNLFCFRTPAVLEGGLPLYRSQRQYERKLLRLARVVVRKLELPEIIALQEVENRATDSQALDDLVARIALESKAVGRHTRYEIAIDRGCSDRRKISCAFLFCPRRVEQIGAAISHDRQASAEIAADAQGTQLMRRPLLEACFCLRSSTSSKPPLHLLGLHLKAGAPAYAERRFAQSSFIAERVGDILAREPEADLLVCGDFNVDYNHAKQRSSIALEATPTLENLMGRLARKERYSIVLRGNNRLLLDWMYASSTLQKQLKTIKVLHVNSRKPPGQRGSDHDPILATFCSV